MYDPVYFDGGSDEHYILDFSDGNSNGLPETGRIAGIEFSPFVDEPFYMYVSCQNLGLIKIDWRDGTLIEQISSDFSRTYVQTAPDGNVYAVLNDGTGLGKIDKSEGHPFDDNAFEYPKYGNSDWPTMHINYKQDSDENKYFTLPENDQPVIKVDVQAANILCDHTTTIASIYVSGGIPPYEIEVKRGTTNVSGQFTWDDECGCFRGTQLIAGTYEYTITDSGTTGENGIEGEFEIAEGDAYDFEDNLLEINNQTASNINGLSDLVWDQNDVSPQKGFLLDNTIMFKHGFRLDSNTVLTINNLRLEFDEDFLAKVIIEPGSKLILNNCTLTNYHCSDTAKKWAGVQVWGQREFSNQREAYHGKIVMNNSTIEHAHEAVQLFNPDNFFNSSGGMIYAENSDFINNRRAVSFISFENLWFIDSTTYEDSLVYYYTNYRSSFDHCQFLNNGDYLPDNGFYSFVSMWDVKGIPFKACTFNAGSKKAMGIDAIDAGFTLSSDCDGPIGPDGCPPENLERCEFYNFDMAIYARNTDEFILKPINIQHTYFFNNNFGAYLSNLHNLLKVNTSEFIVGNDWITKEKTICGEFMGRGIHIEYSNGFEIENNSFAANPAAPYPDSLIGILAKNNPSNHDIIYNNDFNDLKIANDAIGINREVQGNDYYGLEYQCNDNVNNSIDFEVLDTEVDGVPYPGEIFTYMGDNELYGSARNSYTSTSTSGFYKHWNHMGVQSIQYYLHESEEGSIYEPTAVETVSGPLPSNYFQFQDTDFVNECADGSGIHIERTTLTPEEKEEQEIAFAGAYQNFEAVESIYNDLKDGGSTEGTSLSIEAAQPGDTWELRNNLLGKSPYLSREVLELAANRTDVLPNSVLLDVLAANPDELKKEDFIQFLENKEEPLPDYMIDILRDLSSGTTYKTALINQMNIQKRNQIDAANKMIKSLVNEEEQDREAIKGWLANKENLQSDMQIATLLIADEDYAEANALLDLLPELYNLDNIELEHFNARKDLLTLKMQLKQEDRSIAQLSNNEIAELEYMASGVVGLARISARHILETFYGYNDFCDCIDRNSNKSSASFTYKEESESPLKIEATPNPATHYVEFYYELSEIDTEGMITITDINGKLIQTFGIKYERGKQAWDTRKVPSGSYIYTLKTKYFEKSGKLIIQ